MSPLAFCDNTMDHMSIIVTQQHLELTKHYLFPVVDILNDVRLFLSLISKSELVLQPLLACVECPAALSRAHSLQFISDSCRQPSLSNSTMSTKPTRVKP